MASAPPLPCRKQGPFLVALGVAREPSSLLSPRVGRDLVYARAVALHKATSRSLRKAFIPGASDASLAGRHTVRSSDESREWLVWGFYSARMRLFELIRIGKLVPGRGEPHGIFTVRPDLLVPGTEEWVA